MKEPTLHELIELLHLTPLVGEGGLWSQPYRSDEMLPAGTLTGRDTARAICSTIYFLLTPTTFSCMHRLKSDEIWYYHCGAAAELLLLHPDGRCELRRLGCDLAAGERPQITVPRGTWMGAHLAEDKPYCLMSTSGAPAYEDSDFEAGSYEALAEHITDPALLPLLRKLTGAPQYT